MDGAELVTVFVLTGPNLASILHSLASIPPLIQETPPLPPSFGASQWRIVAVAEDYIVCFTAHYLADSPSFY